MINGGYTGGDRVLQGFTTARLETAGGGAAGLFLDWSLCLAARGAAMPA